MNEKFERLMDRAEQLIARIESVLPQPLGAPDWNASIAFRYRKRSSGHGVLEPVRQVARMQLDHLREIDGQKEKIQRNTLHFVQGLPANNVLLTGARGTGKSSLVKACLNEYAPRGLRLIEVDKADLVDLPDIVDVVAERQERFIVFCDDLSFEEWFFAPVSVNAPAHRSGCLWVCSGAWELPRRGDFGWLWRCRRMEAVRPAARPAEPGQSLPCCSAWLQPG